LQAVPQPARGLWNASAQKACLSEAVEIGALKMGACLPTLSIRSEIRCNRFQI
jgi:hypothetical protein